MKWFNNPTTLSELKEQYKKLCMQNHPDLGGNTADMQEINNEYELLFEKLKNVHRNSEGETYTKESTETAEEFIHIIEVLTPLKNILVEICGSWIWVSGNTKEHKDILKGLHFKYAYRKEAWYFHTEPYKKKGKRELTLDEIRDMFGSQSYQKKSEKQLALQD